jgi:hypothetical protein
MIFIDVKMMVLFKALVPQSHSLMNNNLGVLHHLILIIREMNAYQIMNHLGLKFKYLKELRMSL